MQNYDKVGDVVDSLLTVLFKIHNDGSKLTLTLHNYNKIQVNNKKMT